MADRTGPAKGTRYRLPVPKDFAETLRALAAAAPTGPTGSELTDAASRLDSVLMTAWLQGWTLSALAEPLGVSRQRVEDRVQRAKPRTDLPPIPVLPRRPNPVRKPPRPRVLIKAELAVELRRMHAVARTVNGATPAGHRSRAVSVEFTAVLQSLIEQGVSVYTIAKALGVTQAAVWSRLARHGYRTPSPSQVAQTYTGRPKATTSHG